MSSQNKDIEYSNCIKYLKYRHIILNSGSEEIDVFIQERQLEIKDHNDVILEWIPYNKFNQIREIGKNGSITIYSAIWKNGPLYWNIQKEKYIRGLNIRVALKCFHNLKNPIKFVINEV